MKFTYTPLVNLNNQSSAIANINNNMAAIQTAMEKTLSRDGTSPNAMQSSLDMNGNHILNLPTPTQSTDAVRLQDITGPVSIITNNNIIYYNILDYIPVNLHAAIQAYTSTSDVTSYINTAISAVNATGGVLLFPRGRYYITSSIGQANLRNITLLGVGGRDLSYNYANTGTVFYYTGTGSDPIFNFTDARGLVCSDFQVVYTSNLFIGGCFNCNSALSTGNSNKFSRIQFYKFSGFPPYTAQYVWYLRNNVDIYFDDCYVSHAFNGWVGMYDGDTGETNMIGLHKCTSIHLVSHAIVNPFIGWSIVGTNFEPDAANAPSGILTTASKSISNLSLVNSVFADATQPGLWVTLRNIHGFTMVGGSINGNNPASGITGIKFEGSFNSGISIHGVLFGNITTGIDFNGILCYGVAVHGNTFLNIPNEIINDNLVDAYSSIISNYPSTVNRPLSKEQGGTGSALSTGSGANVLAVSPAFTGTPTFASAPYMNNGIVVTAGNSNFKANNGGDIAAVIYNTANSGESVGFTFQDNSTSKWNLYKDSLHNFVLYDFPNSISAITVTPSAISFGHTDFAYTTAATSTTTGAIRNAGGLGNAGAGFFGGTVVSHANTAIPAGGSTGAGLAVSATPNFGVFFGSGVPTLSAAQGSLYLRSDGSSTSTRMYVNTDGATAWTAVTTDT